MCCQIDFSDYPQDSKFFDPVNKKVFGKMKDEVKGKITRDKMKRIQRKLDKIGTYDVCKISLPCFNDKRCILDDGINSLAYFHKNIKSQ